MRTLCLCILAIAFLAPAQEAPAHFLIECELGASVDVTHLTQPQMATFQQHGAYLSKLRDQGVVIVGGHTDKDAAAARTLATDDPAVKAGLLKFSVETFTLAIPPK